MNPPPKVILLAEDDPNDVLLIRRAIRKFSEQYQLEVVEDGVEVVDYLSGTGVYEDRERYPLPFLLLLDIKMPRKSGLEVLEWLRDQARLPAIHIAILTSSSLQEEIDQAYALGTNSFLTKQTGFQNLLNLVAQLEPQGGTFSSDG